MDSTPFRTPIFIILPLQSVIVALRFPSLFPPSDLSIPFLFFSPILFSPQIKKIEKPKLKQISRI